LLSFRYLLSPLPSPANQFRYDLSDYIFDDCTNQPVRITSGVQHVVITSNCETKGTITICEVYAHGKLDNVKLFWPDGTTGTVTYDGLQKGTSVFDFSTGTTTEQDIIFVHENIVSRGPNQNEIIKVSQSCTTTYGPDGFFMNPVLNQKCVA